MHGAAFFASGQGGAEENFIGWGRARHGVKSLRRGKGNYSQTRGIFRAERGSLETFWGQGGPGQPFFQRPGGNFGVHLLLNQKLRSVDQKILYF